MDTKVCLSCNQLYSIDNFYKKGKQLSTYCKECYKQQSKEAYQKRIDFLNQYKAEAGCKKCGETKYYLLDFHHRNPTEKDFNIAKDCKKKLEIILKELEKCDVLCANCHREWHYLQEHNNISYDTWLLNQTSLSLAQGVCNVSPQFSNTAQGFLSVDKL